MTFSYELGRPSLHFVKNHPAKFPWWDEVALWRAALDSSHVAGAAFDVFTEEPAGSG
jgi:hypothetical protein